MVIWSNQGMTIGWMKRCACFSFDIASNLSPLNNHNRCFVGSVRCYLSLFSDVSCWLCPTLGCNTGWKEPEAISRGKVRNSAIVAEHQRVTEHGKACKHVQVSICLKVSERAMAFCSESDQFWRHGDQWANGCFQKCSTSALLVVRRQLFKIFKNSTTFIFSELFCSIVWRLWIPGS